MSTKAKKTGFWNMLDRLEGDKIIWMIVFLLIIFSILAVSSSTSLLAIQQKSSRLSFAMEQILMAAVGLGIIAGLCKIGKIGIFRFFSQGLFVLSFLLLAFLASHFTKIPFFRPVNINQAWRCISVFGFQLHVFEFVKVFMVMYIAWAMDALKTNRTPLADKLAKKPHLEFMAKKEAKVCFYVLFPIAIIIYVMLLGIVGVGLIFGVYKISDGKVFGRLELIERRVKLALADPLERLHAEKPGTLKFQKILDETMQPVSAKVAVSEGGFFGKGPGNSTQRYVVSVMYEDYIFSFIVEEYGMIGALVILILYGSLLARGSIIVRNCDNHYAKTMIAGLVLLVSGQALMHILINVDLFPLTGQTLPMISHGNSSFLAFSLVFGVLLSVSKMAQKKIEQETAAAAPIFVTEDEVKDGLDDLDQLESSEIQ